MNFYGEPRRNTTHASATDPQARLFRKGAGREAKLYYMGHVLMENRHGLVVNARATPAAGTAERDVALELARGLPHHERVTLGAAKSYDTRDFIFQLRQLDITPHVAQHTRGRASAIDGRTPHHPGYALSQRKRKRVEEIFGWLKTRGLMHKTRHRGEPKANRIFILATAVYNLVRIRNLAQMPT